MRAISSSLFSKIGLALTLASLLVLASILLLMFSIRNQNIELVGATTARSIANQTFSLRDFYAGEVVPRGREAGVEFDVDFDTHLDVLPLPATLVKVLGQEIENQDDGSAIRLYSRYPFSNRGDSETYDTFELAALEALEANPDSEYYEVTQNEHGSVMRFAVADVMRESCVSCHNQHPLSTKTDWQVGDFRGVLSISVPVNAASSSLQNATTSLGGVLLVGLASLGLFIFAMLRSQVINPLQKFAVVSQNVVSGDLSTRVDVTSTDEIGQLAETFNSMLASTEARADKDEELNRELANAIDELTQEVNIISSGDLSINLSSRSDLTSPITNSLTDMVEQLRAVINQVKTTTFEISSSVNQIQASAENLVDGSETQAERIINTSAAVDEMTVSIQRVSENAALSATVGEQARANARKGSTAVQNTIEGMDRIRDTVQQTSKRIKRLGETSQEIGEIVRVISDIAKRTSILSLNASIQAARAGEAGRGFAVVAQEVERLAERSTGAAKQIEGLIRTIQIEMNEAATAMELTTTEVVEGSELANEAGTALEEIETVSNRLAELIQSISLAAKQQARGSETIAHAMNDIATVTQQTAAGTKETTVSIGNMADLAEELRSSVDTFKLEETY